MAPNNGSDTNLAVGGDLASYGFGKAWLSVKTKPEFNHGGHGRHIAILLKALLLQPLSPRLSCFKKTLDLNSWIRQ
jgi:hypothetical protein